MPRYPFFGFPNMYYRPYPNYNYQNSNKIPNTQTQFSQKNTTKKEDFQEAPKEEKRNINEEIFLDLLGIKLHFDDILLLSLIFFLYNEGVKDEGLFLALILLLLT